MIPSLLAVREISPFKFYEPAGAHSGPTQASDIDLFARTVIVSELTSLTIFSKHSILDV